MLEIQQIVTKRHYEFKPHGPMSSNTSCGIQDPVCADRLIKPPRWPISETKPPADARPWWPMSAPLAYFAQRNPAPRMRKRKKETDRGCQKTPQKMAADVFSGV